MEERQFQQLGQWFSQLNQRIDPMDLKIENRFTALVTVCTNIRKDIEEVRSEIRHVKEANDRYDARISVIELALKELERRMSH